MNSQRVLEMGVARAVSLIRAGKPESAAVALDVAMRAAMELDKRDGVTP